MTELSNRNLSLAVRATVVVRRVEPRFDIRFGPSRVKMESLEARRLLSADGLLDFNGIPLPATDSSWTSISLVDETGSTIEAATSDGSVTLLDLVTYEDGTQYYEVSMSSIDPIVFYNTFNDDGGIYPFDPLSAGIEQAEGTPTLDLAGFSDEFPVISLSVSADGVVSAGDVAGVSSDISGSIFLNGVITSPVNFKNKDNSTRPPFRRRLNLTTTKEY